MSLVYAIVGMVVSAVVSYVCGSYLVGNGAKLMVEQNKSLKEENDRLYRRLSMIGERAMDSQK